MYRTRPTDNAPLRFLLIAAITAATTCDGSRSTVSPGLTVPARLQQTNPFALGLKSANACSGQLLVPVRAASAFSGTVLPLQPPTWGHRFFPRVKSLRPVEENERAKTSSRVDAIGMPRKITSNGDSRRFPANLTRRINSLLSKNDLTAQRSAFKEVKAPTDSASRPLTFWEAMACGAISRSVSQTITHPANAMKTILQSTRDEAVSIATLIRKENIHLLTRGAGAQLALSLPQGAVNFAILEYTRKMTGNLLARSNLGAMVEKNGVVSAGLDFLSSAAATVACLVVSGPTTVVTDNIMAGTYPSLDAAVVGIASTGGVQAFYRGWKPQLLSRIPSYGLTWVFFQRFKELHHKVFDKPPNDMENLILGCMSSGVTVGLLMPLDTIKTRLVTQTHSAGMVPYKGVSDCAFRIVQEEGVGALYRGLSPRLLSVVPLVGIQFGVYEFMKRKCQEHSRIPRKEERVR